jgi:hypothetical protein
MRRINITLFLLLFLVGFVLLLSVVTAIKVALLSSTGTSVQQLIGTLLSTAISAAVSAYILARTFVPPAHPLVLAGMSGLLVLVSRVVATAVIDAYLMAGMVRPEVLFATPFLVQYITTAAAAAISVFLAFLVARKV